MTILGIRNISLSRGIIDWRHHALDQATVTEREIHDWIFE